MKHIAMVAALALVGLFGGCAAGYSSKDGWYGRVEITPEDVRGYAK